MGGVDVGACFAQPFVWKLGVLKRHFKILFYFMNDKWFQLSAPKMTKKQGIAWVLSSLR